MMSLPAWSHVPLRKVRYLWSHVPMGGDMVPEGVTVRFRVW